MLIALQFVSQVYSLQLFMSKLTTVELISDFQYCLKAHGYLAFRCLKIDSTVDFIYTWENSDPALSIATFLSPWDAFSLDTVSETSDVRGSLYKCKCLFLSVLKKIKCFPVLVTHGYWGYDSRVLRIWLTGTAFPHGYWGYDSRVLMIWLTGNAYPHGYCIPSRVLHIVYTGWKREHLKICSPLVKQGTLFKIVADHRESEEKLSCKIKHSTRELRFCIQVNKVCSQAAKPQKSGDHKNTYIQGFLWLI